MKPQYFKSLNIRIFIFCLLLLCTVLIIHSCKKNNADKTGENNLSQNINQAKAWYENTYPINSKYSISRSVVRPGNSNLNSNPQFNTGFDYSKFIKPDWKHAASYTRFNAGVLELPIDPSSPAIGTALSISPHGNALYNPKYSRSSFLILNDSTGYHAYIMTIIADSAYVNNDLSILGRNKYNERDVDFSGVALYSTPDGNFVNGWIYKNGNIVLALPPGQKQSSGAAANTNTAITRSATKKSRFANHTLMLEIETCYTWYQTTTVNGVTSDPVVLDETCYTTYIDDTGGGTGSSGSTGVSGSSGSSGGSAPAPVPIPPCIVPAASPSAAALPGNRNMIRVVQTTGSGFPAPTSTTTAAPCPTKTTTTTQIDTIGSLMKNPNSLTAAQKAQIQAVLNQILQNCIGQATFNYFNSNNDKFDFEVNSAIAEPASYNPTTNVINIQNPATVTPAALQEELFHAYQNKTMPGGTAQYAGKAGDANIEFEAKLLRDITYYINPGTVGNEWAVSGDNYTEWLGTITNGGTSFPTSFTSSQLTTYFLYMGDWLNQNPGYSSDIINGNLNPTVMFNLINSSACSN